jgi:hypothetical protein
VRGVESSPRIARHTRKLSGAGLVAAAERIEATLATSGWADIVGVLDEEIARINQQLGGSEPLEHAKYAHLCGQLRGLVAIGETVSTVLTKRDEWLAEQAEKHEGRAPGAAATGG